MAHLLHIETATSVCSVCISKDIMVVSRHTAEEPRVHTKSATLMIQKVIKDANLSMQDLDAVVISDGPGSYTGLRVGASIAKGLCFGLDIPLIRINTLRSLAHRSAAQISEAQYLHIPMIDARRMEVYLAHYDAKMTCKLDNRPYIYTNGGFDHLLDNYQKLVFSGNAVAKISEVADNENFIFTDIVCDSVNLVQLAYEKYKSEDFEDLAYYTPNYIKPPNITVSKKKLL